VSFLKPDAPTPPNPAQTAAAQTGTNVSTAVANNMLNNMNQVTPQGSLSYSNTGSFSWTDPSTGQTYNIPLRTATQQLSPTQQNIFSLGQQSQTNLAGLAANQSGMLQNLLGSPFNMNGSPGSPGTAATQSGIFNPQAYLAAYPDVAQWAAANGVDPFKAATDHYQQFGNAEGRTAGFPMIPGTPATPATGPAPRAGDPNSLSGFSLDDSYGNPYDRQLRDFGDAGALTRSYGPGDFSADRQRVEQSMYERMDPQLQRDRAQMEARLADQGIKIGSPAYQAAMDQFGRQLTDTRLGITEKGGAEQQRMMDMAAQRAGFENAAQKQAFEQAQGRGTFYNAAQQQDFTQEGLRAQFKNTTQGQRMAMAQAKMDAENNARKQWLSEQYAQRQAPINEITALMSGSQVQQPTFVNTASSQIPTTDYAGLTNNRFSQDMQNYQQSSQNFNQIMGGIFGAVAGLTRSDRREKDVGEKLGTVFAAGADGEKPLPIYEYAYKDDPASTRHVGPMAQDVEKVDRKSVKTVKGTKYIDMTRMGSILRNKVA